MSDIVCCVVLGCVSNCCFRIHVQDGSKKCEIHMCFFEWDEYRTFLYNNIISHCSDVLKVGFSTQNLWKIINNGIQNTRWIYDDNFLIFVADLGDPFKHLFSSIFPPWSLLGPFLVPKRHPRPTQDPTRPLKTPPKTPPDPQKTPQDPQKTPQDSP